MKRTWLNVQFCEGSELEKPLKWSTCAPQVPLFPLERCMVRCSNVTWSAPSICTT